MSNMTPSRLGVDSFNTNQGDRTLFLKVYGGEVLAAFESTTVTFDKHTIRTIPHGKSVSFPTMWKMKAKYHTPGEVINGQSVAHSERLVTIDDLLIADAFIDKLDEAMNHYDVRSGYSKEAGSALARHFDLNVLQMGIKGAREPLSGKAGIVNDKEAPGGSVLENPKVDTESDALAESIIKAAQTFDEKDIPSQDRYVFLRPKHYYMLASNLTVLNKDWGGAGSYSDGKVIKIAGITIVEANNLPNADYTQDKNIKEKYRDDFSNTVGLVIHKTALGTAKLLDVATEVEWLIQYQGNLIVAKMALGTGVLRPEACLEISKKAPVKASS